MSASRNKSSISTTEPAKRIACDRCHGQKLRCPREGKAAETCGRCQKAGVECIYSSPLRMGRPSGSQSGESTGRKRRRTTLERANRPINNVESDEPVEVDTLQLAAGLSSREDTLSQYSVGDSNIGQEADYRDLDIYGGDRSSIHPINWPLENTLSPLSSVFESLTTGHPFELDESLGQYWSMTPEETPPAQNCSALNVSSLETSPANMADCIERALAEQTLSGGNSSHNPSLSSQPMEAKANKSSDETSSARIEDPMEDCIVQLSELNLTLYRRCRTIDSAKSTTGFDTEPYLSLSDSQSMMEIDETFRASQQLIEILHRLFAQSKIEPKPRSGDESKQWHTYSSSSSSLNYSESASHRDCDFSWGGSSSATSVDKSTVFLVLTCYLRLLHVFDILLTSFRHRLQSAVRNSPAFDSTSKDSIFNMGSLPMSLPGLRVGSFSPPSSSEIQIVLVVQVVAHLLDRMDKAIVLVASPAKLATSVDDDSDDQVAGSAGGTCAGSEDEGSDDDESTRSGVKNDRNTATSNIAELVLKEVGTQERRAKRNVKRVRSLLKESIAL